MDYEGQDNDGVATFTLTTAGYGADPFVFHTREGILQRPATVMHGFDQGSVPKGLAQAFVSPNATSRAFAFHDSAFDNHGWWESTDGVNWKFAPKSREQTDHMLIRWMMADGAGERTAYAAFEGVHLGGSDVWNAHKGPFPADQFTP